MSTDALTLPNVHDWSRLKNPFQLFCPELNEVEQQLLHSFDELETFQAELARQQSLLAERRAALEQEEAQLLAAQAELAAQQFELPVQSYLPASASGVSQEVHLALQEKLLAAEQELELLRDQTTQQTDWAEKHKEEKSQYEEQYSALELELEHVRNRAGELFDTLTCSRTEWELERHNWEQERKELQTLLAHQQEQIKDYLERHETHGVEPAPADPTSEPGVVHANKIGDTAVVGSVLAQFERIRNERAVRRRKAGEGG